MNDLPLLASLAPVGALVPTALLLVVGLILWGAGSRVLRVGFAAIGMIVGAAIGWVVADSAFPGLPGWVFAILGGGVLALLAAATYRTTVAASLAAVLGIAAPLAVWTVAEIGGEVDRGPRESLSEHFARGDDQASGNGPLATHEPATEELDEISRWLRDASARLRDARSAVEGDAPTEPFSTRDEGSETSDDAEPATVPLTAQSVLADWVSAITDSAGELWAQTPASIRPTMAIATIVGILLGALLGVLAPSMWAGTVTAFGGSLLWLLAGRSLLEIARIDTAWLPDTARVAVLIWVAVAIIGLSIQWTIRPRRADKPSWFGRRPSAA